MPLDTSTYNLASLRLDGRRWNELRRVNGQVSTQQASDGSSYFEVLIIMKKLDQEVSTHVSSGRWVTRKLYAQSMAPGKDEETSAEIKAMKPMSTAKFPSLASVA